MPAWTSSIRPAAARASCAVPNTTVKVSRRVRSSRRHGCAAYMPVCLAPATTSGWAACISRARTPPIITEASRSTRQDTLSGPNSPGSPRSTRTGSGPLTPERVQRERRAVVDAVAALHQTPAGEPTDVAHPEPLHHRPGPAVVPLRERDDLLGAELLEREGQSRAADLGRVAATPQVRAHGPADLQPTLPARQPAATGQLAGGAVVGDPLADAGGLPRLAHAGGGAPRGVDGPHATVPGRHGVVPVQPPEVLGVLEVDRLQPEALGEPGAHGLGDDVPQPPVAVGPALHHHAEVARPDPGVRVVLGVVQPRRAQVAVHLDEVVELPADDTVVLPLPVGEHRLEVPEPPAGLLLELAGQRFLRRLARLQVATDDVPDARQQRPVRRAAHGVHPVPVVADQGTYAGRLTHASTVASP